MNLITVHGARRGVKPEEGLRLGSYEAQNLFDRIERIDRIYGKGCTAHGSGCTVTEKRGLRDRKVLMDIQNFDNLNSEYKSRGQTR